MAVGTAPGVFQGVSGASLGGFQVFKRIGPILDVTHHLDNKGRDYERSQEENVTHHLDNKGRDDERSQEENVTHTTARHPHN